MASWADRAAALVLASVLLSGCPPVEEAPVGEVVCPPDSLATWDNTGAPFLLTWCTACHASSLTEDARQEAPAELDFDDLDRFLPYADRAGVRTVDDDAGMPPAGGPSQAERDAFGEWIACGAPE